ncbi:MAG: SpoVR family protein [Pseudomonadota bacterium]
MIRRSILPRHLRILQQEIEQKAREAGLDFFTIIFEILNYDEMNEVASYGGFPSRYPHWRFGMEYNRLAKSSTYGLHKIYEMVINNDPCYAYLLEGNSLVEQKMVMAHVLAHCDFFKSNYFFQNTNRKMIDEMANHRTKIVSIMDRVGIEKTEWYIDACLSIENLLDAALGPSQHLKPGRRAEDRRNEEPAEPGHGEAVLQKAYMAPFMAKPSGANRADERGDEPEVEIPSGIPVSPTTDVLGFLLNYAPLRDWEQTILNIIRNEAYYYVPQAQTKIMNEGWATYWHSRLMTEKFLDASEVIDYADRASAITASGGLAINPYKLGVELLRDIEERWNKGRFGKDWDECQDSALKRSWDTGAGLGMKKIFDVRRIYNDVMFIDEFMTEEFCRAKKLFVFGYSERNKCYEIESKQFGEIKKQLLRNLTNLGSPAIEVVDANYENKGQLLLRHRHNGIDLRLDWAKDTLANTFKIWKRPVLISTVMDETPAMLKFDGKEHTQPATA